MLFTILYVKGDYTRSSQCITGCQATTGIFFAVHLLEENFSSKVTLLCLLQGFKELRCKKLILFYSNSTANLPSYPIFLKIETSKKIFFPKKILRFKEKLILQSHSTFNLILFGGRNNSKSKSGRLSIFVQTPGG